MIKKLYTVRSHKKLFFGLGFAVSGLMLSYTILCLFVLPQTVTYTNVFGMVAADVSKYTLLTWPGISLFLCIAFWADLKRNRRFVSFEGKPELLAQAKALCEDLNSVQSFIISLFFAFMQEYCLNSAKGIPSFSAFICYILIAAIIVYFILFVVRIIKIK